MDSIWVKAPLYRNGCGVPAIAMNNIFFLYPAGKDIFALCLSKEIIR